MNGIISGQIIGANPPARCRRSRPSAGAAALVLGVLLGMGPELTRVCGEDVQSGRGAVPDGESLRRDAVVAAVEKVMPSVVNIATEEVVPVRDPLEQLFREFFDPYYRRRSPNTTHSLGSGVIIDEEGYLLTNFHVVARARRIRVKLHDGREFEAEWISGTAMTDVALLRLKGAEGERFVVAPFAEDDDLMLGETVIALGNPFGLGGSVSRGILSSKSRRPPREGEELDVMDWLQTDAAINPGNSGGPLINLKGELIGLNVAIHREGQGIGFAVPVKRIARSLAEIYSPESLNDVWFGAALRPGRAPQTVLSVEEGSPAAAAGLMAGDRILGLNGGSLEGGLALVRRLSELGAGAECALRVSREGRERTVTVRLAAEGDFFNVELIRKRTGASLQELTPELARAFGLGQLQGLLVAGVDKGSAADDARLDRGMVITRLEGRPAVDLIEAARVFHRTPPGQSVKAEVVVPRQRGRFYTLEQVTLDWRLP